MIGEVVRLRAVRCLHPDGTSWAEFAPDRETKRDRQHVFVCAVLGTEKKVLTDPKDALDIPKAMANLGWVPRESASVPDAPEELLRTAEECRHRMDAMRDRCEEPRQRLELTAENLKCSGKHLISLTAKKNREILQQVLAAKELALVEVERRKEETGTIVLLDVVDFGRFLTD